MGESTGIGWTDHTANFWMGCQRVSPGCEHCYAETLVTGRMGFKVWGPASTTERKRAKGVWSDVPKWDAAARRDGVRRKVFVSSLADIFEDHPQVAPWRADALALLERCTNLDVQLLTKRPQNILAMVPPSWRAAWPAHVWIGTTVEDQRRAEERIPHLLAVPAAVRFLSCEPLLERIDLDPPTCPTCAGHEAEAGDDGATPFCPEHCDEMAFNAWLDACASATQPGINWVIVGGESGPGARPFDLAWARSILRQCAEAGVASFCKQLGARPFYTTQDSTYVDEREDERPLRLRDRAGADPAEWPTDLRVQQFPGGAAMTRSVVVSPCHSGRVTRAPLCPACVLSPIDVPPADPTPCADCGGRRVVQKLSVGAIPCPACRPPQRECHHCGGVGVVAGRPCEGAVCRARGGVR